MLPGGDNQVYVTIAGDAEQLVNDLKQITPAAQQADTAITGLNEAIAASGGMSAEALGQVGVASVEVFRNGIQLATQTLTELQAKLGQISSAEAKAALSGLGFDSATTRQAITDYQTLGNTFTDTSTKKDVFKVNVGLLGDMMRYVRLSAFLIFMTALNDIRTAFTNAIKDAIDFSNAIFNLDVAVRAWQRSGFDVSLQQVHDQIAKIQQLYPYFNVSDMDTAMAKLINGTREFGVTAQQAFQLYGDAAKIATVNNITLEEAVTKLLQAVESGRLQSLRTLGVPASAQLELEYEQKLAAVMDNTTSKMTVQEKSAAALGLIHEYLSKTADDVSQKQDTLAGKTTAVSTAWKNWLTSMGSLFGPFLKLLDDFVLKLIDFVKWIDITALEGLGTFINSVVIAEDAIRQFTTKGSIDVDALKKKFDDLQASSKKLAEGLFANTGDVLGNVPVGPPADLTSNSNMLTAMADAKTKLEKIQEDLKTNLEKLWTNYYEDLDKITLDGQRKEEDLQLQYARQIEKLNQDLQNNIEKENQSYQDKLLANEISYQQSIADAKKKYQEQIIADEEAYQQNLVDAAKKEQEKAAQDELSYQQSVADAKAKYQQQVIDDEKKYQEALAKLRSDLENNLEDALATRDARQITRLIRTEKNSEDDLATQYAQQKADRDAKFAQELADLQKQYDRKKADRATQYAQELADLLTAYDRQKVARDEKFAQELADLKTQEDQRTAQLLTDHQNRLRDIEIQYNEQLAAERTKLIQAEADLVTLIAQQRADRLLKFQQDTADLHNQTGKLLADLATSLQDQYNLTATDLDRIYQLYDSYYGPDGSLLAMMFGFYNYIGQLGGGGGGGGGQKFMAEGGAFVANRPTNVTFGEAGPEAAFFMPLNGSKMGNLGSLGSNISGGGSGGKLSLELWLSPDLQARVINQAQAGIVSVIMKELA
jgi:hypothetical protein